jgi:chromosome segregation ATPase
MSGLTTRTPGLIAAEINKIKEDTKRILIYNSIEIGRKLTEAKEMLPHGEWGKWLKTEVDYSKTTANNLMKIFQEYGSEQINLLGDNLKSKTFGNLNYSQATLLLGVPAEEREKFVEENNVEEMSARELKKAIEELKKTEEEKEKALKAMEEAEEKARQESEARQALEDAFNSGAEERRKLEEEKESLIGKINGLEKKIEELNTIDKEVSVSTEEIDKEIEERIQELKDKLEETNKEKNKLEDKLKAAEEGVTNSEIEYKIVFDTIVTNYDKLLKKLTEMQKENEVAYMKYKSATKRFLEYMLTKL